LNIIIDIILAYNIITWTIFLIEAGPNPGWCGIVYGYPRPGNPNQVPEVLAPNCREWQVVVRILMGIAGGFGGFVGYVSSS
jgi:hypothetical protein